MEVPRPADWPAFCRAVCDVSRCLDHIEHGLLSFAKPSQIHKHQQRGRLQVLVHLEEQSPDIGQGVHGLGTKTLEEIGAGDQGHMFGYATDETEELMPLTHVLATRLGFKLTEVGLIHRMNDGLLNSQGLW
jgi:hypothetical protein